MRDTAGEDGKAFAHHEGSEGKEGERREKRGEERRLCWRWLCGATSAACLRARPAIDHPGAPQGQAEPPSRLSARADAHDGVRVRGPPNGKEDGRSLGADGWTISQPLEIDRADLALLSSAESPHGDDPNLWTVRLRWTRSRFAKTVGGRMITMSHGEEAIDLAANDRNARVLCA